MWMLLSTAWQRSSTSREPRRAKLKTFKTGSTQLQEGLLTSSPRKRRVARQTRVCEPLPESPQTRHRTVRGFSSLAGSVARYRYCAVRCARSCSNRRRNHGPRRPSMLRFVPAEGTERTAVRGRAGRSCCPSADRRDCACGATSCFSQKGHLLGRRRLPFCRELLAVVHPCRGHITLEEACCIAEPRKNVLSQVRLLSQPAQASAKR